MRTEEQGAETKKDLLGRAAGILAEVTGAGPYTVSSDWFTLDLSMPQVRAVFLLLQENPQRMSGLATKLDISLSRATGLVDRLVEKGLVSRWTDPEDRRSVLCVPTEEGRLLGGRLLEARRSRWEERLAPLSKAELKRVCQAMELVREAASQTTPERSLSD